MATGTILKIADPPTAGAVTQDETADVYPFTDSNFPNTGLQIGSPCTFDLIQDPSNPTDPTALIATNLQPVNVANTTTITTPVTQDITVNSPNTLTITSTGSVTGSITINGGKLIVEGNVTGNTQITNHGVYVVRKGGKVMGNINANTGGNLKVVNQGKVVGNVQAQSAGRLMLGNSNGPGTITGAVDIAKIRAIDITSDSVIN